MHMAEHIAVPATGVWPAQPPVATPASRSFPPPATSTARNRSRSGTNWELRSKMSSYGYKADPDYQGPRLPPPPRPVIGYPYLPHNPTQPELEACIRRISTLRSRSFSESRSEGNGADNQQVMSGSRTGDNSVSSRRSQPRSRSEPTDAGHHSDEEYAEESSGPQTPYSPEIDLWHDRAPAFAGSEQVPRVPKMPARQPAVALPVEQMDGHYDPSNPGSSSGSGPSLADRAFAYASIELILYKFNSLVLGFKFPSNPEFLLPQGDEVFPRIALTSRNKALLSHKHELEKLLDRLDSIESHGDDEVRKVRKEAVIRVTREMDDLNRLQAMAWYNHLYEQKQGKA